MEQPEISVVLPSYLEEENLRFLLPRILDTLRASGRTHEVVVVDTVAPLDGTAAVCEALGARYINRTPGNTFGDAVRTGIDEARGQNIIFMDADGSHTPEFIQNLIDAAPGHDVVIASRYVEGGFTDNSMALIAMSRLLNWTYSVVLGLRCKDVSNSFKLYRAEQLKSLQLSCANFDIVEEILHRLNKANPGLKIKEIPFSFKQRAFGKTKRNLVIFVFTYLQTIIRLKRT